MTQKVLMEFLERIFRHWIFETHSVSIPSWVFNHHFELALTESLGRHIGTPVVFYLTKTVILVTGDDNQISPPKNFFNWLLLYVYMDCCGNHPEYGSVERCYKRVNTATFTKYEGLVNFQNGPVRIFVSERYLEDGSNYQFIRTNERRLPSSGRVIRVFEATKI